MPIYAEQAQQQFAAMKFAVLVGEVIQGEHPEIAKLYREGSSQAQIAQYLTERGLSLMPRSRSTLENSVKIALRGNSDEELGKLLSGLLPIEEYRTISYRNREDARSNGGKIVKRQGLGVFSLSSEQLRSAAIESAKSRGRIPWCNESENIEAKTMFNQQEYINNGRVLNAKIAKVLNAKYHQGSPVRTRKSVHEFFRRAHLKK